MRNIQSTGRGLWRLVARRSVPCSAREGRRVRQYHHGREAVFWESNGETRPSYRMAGAGVLLTWHCCSLPADHSVQRPVARRMTHVSKGHEFVLPLFSDATLRFDDWTSVTLWIVLSLTSLPSPALIQYSLPLPGIHLACRVHSVFFWIPQHASPGPIHDRRAHCT